MRSNNACLRVKLHEFFIAQRIGLLLPTSACGKGNDGCF
jgi:hypothetical protein